MQTNVPKPYGIRGKAPVHLNMPGGQWAQDDKYVSGDLQQHHHSKITSTKKSGIRCASLGSWGITPSMRGCDSWGTGRRGIMTWCAVGRLVDRGRRPIFPTCSNNVCLPNNPAICRTNLYGNGLMSCTRSFHTCDIHMQSSSASEPEKDPKTQLSSGQKLQRAVKEYGTTVIVFHVTISLASLGICYLLVSR